MDLNTTFSAIDQLKQIRAEIDEIKELCQQMRAFILSRNQQNTVVDETAKDHLRLVKSPESE